MGEVYEAEQESPLRRKVALKLIKWGMDTKRLIARFDTERQALALMNHAAIAKVFDAGATDTGRPFFAMEYVEGVPITQYCDTNRLTIRERLQLFGQVCSGVQHAHQKGIIHRDIKASNVLVTVQDEKPVPKIIDFGVARATEQRETERTVFTEYGMLIGTPEYMSPEQADMTQVDIDTRTDVYSLGVLLYELLTGVLPFDSKELRQAGIDELRRMIREEEPSKPSSRLSTLGDTSTEIAHRRRTEPPTLEKQLKGDLDWILLKALEKDRTRRYDSPMELAADVERHIRHHPVLATPPTFAYRFGKIVRRNRLLAASVALISTSLILAAVVSTIFALREAKQRREVEAARSDLEVVVGFQAEMLGDTDAQGMGRWLVSEMRRQIEENLRSRGRTDESVNAVLAAFDSSLESVNTTDVALRLIDERILDRAAGTLETRFAESPLIAAHLQDTTGDTYRRLGLYDRGRPLLLASLATRERLLGRDHPDTLTSMSNLAVLYLMQGNLEQAEPLFVEVLKKRREVLGDDHEDTIIAIDNLGALLYYLGRLDEAESYFREALERGRRVHGDDHKDTIIAIGNLGSFLYMMGKFDEAESFAREAAERSRRVLGEDHPDTLSAINNLCDLISTQGKLEEAEQFCLESEERCRRVLGNEHPTTLISLSNMGALLDSQGKLEEAEPYYREALEGGRRVLGNDHTSTLTSANNLAYLLKMQGKLEEAEPLYQEALDGFRRVLGDDHPNTLSLMDNMGMLLQEMGRVEMAGPYYRDALEGRRRVLGDDHPKTLQSIYNLACLASLRGRRSEALSLLRETVEGGWANGPLHDQPALAALHGDPEFEAIAADVNRRKAEADDLSR